MLLLENAITAVFNGHLDFISYSTCKTSICFRLILIQKSLTVICPKYYLLLLIETRLIFLKALFYNLLLEMECVNIKINWYLIIMDCITASDIKQKFCRCVIIYTCAIFLVQDSTLEIRFHGDKAVTKLVIVNLLL